MQVLFRRGGLYEYSDVSADEFISVLRPAPEHNQSVGTAFGALIKGRKTYRRLEGTPWPSGQAPAPTQAAETSPATSETAPALPAEVSRKSTELTLQASLIEVIDPKTQEMASEILLAIAGMRKEIADTFKPMKDAAFKTHRTICDQERTLDTPLLEAEQTLKRAIGSFVAEQKRLAAEAEAAERRRLQEEADRIAAEESQRLAIEDAVALEAEGKIDEAEAVLANPIPVQPVRVAPAPVVPAVAQVKGVRTTQVWKFRITDANKIPREYLVVNESAIKAVVSRTNGKIQIPGVETYPEEQVAASRRG